MPTIWLWGGFGWLAALPRSRFEVRRSSFDVQPPAGTSNGGKPPAAPLPQAWLILLSRAEAGGAPGILKVLPRESRNRNQISLNAETQRARRSTARQSRNRMDKDRIMAGQNQVEQRRDLRWQDLKRQGRMILSCHDSVCLPRLHKEPSQLANDFDYCIAEEKSAFIPLSLRSSANLRVSALILRRLRGYWSAAVQSHRLFPRRAPVPPAPNPNQDTAPHTSAQEWDNGRPNPPGG